MNDQETYDVSIWINKEIDNLFHSAIRVALLAIIKQHEEQGGIHGYAIGEALYGATQGEISSTKATFYAILRKLEQDGLVTAQLKSSPTGPARKHYLLTSKGLRALNALLVNWDHYYGIITSLTNAMEVKTQ